MRTVTLAESRRNLDIIVKRFMDDSEPAIMLTDLGERVVPMPLDDEYAWSETHNLLSNPVNADRLRKSIIEAEAESVEVKELQVT